jgi:sigma-70-like protein
MADDHELWERICRGDTSAFEGFYRENAPRLQAFLGQLLSTPQAAEDVVQETFLQLLKRPNGFRPDTSLRASCLESRRGARRSGGGSGTRPWRPTVGELIDPKRRPARW